MFNLHPPRHISTLPESDRIAALRQPSLTCASILLGQHDGDDALGDRRIGRVRRVIRQILVEIIDLEKDHLAVGFERAKVVFFIRVVGMTKIVIRGDCVDDSGDSFGAEGGDACGHDGMAVGQVAAQLVIERANAVGGESPWFASIRELGEGKLGPQTTTRAVMTKAQVLTGVGFNSATAPACCTAFACSG